MTSPPPSFIIKEGICEYSEATLLRSFLLFCRITQHLQFHVAADQNERKQAGHVSHDARGFPSKSEHVNVSKSLLLTIKLPQCAFPYDVSRALSQQKKNKEPFLSHGTCLWFLIYSLCKLSACALQIILHHFSTKALFYFHEAMMYRFWVWEVKIHSYGVKTQKKKKTYFI